jgi:trk/ktr system potassium uptake protein
MGGARTDERGASVNVVIVGCGRVGASVAESFDRAGDHVTIVDLDARSFDRLPADFGGEAVRGDGTDEDILRRSGADGADLFIALTEGDNRNTMAAQLAAEALGVKRVIAKINDPLRAQAYAELGIGTLCRTGLMLDAIHAYIGREPSGLPGMLGPTGHHPGGEDHGSLGPVRGGREGDVAEAPEESAAPSTMFIPSTPDREA